MGVWAGPGSGIGGWGDLTRGLGGVGVLEAGLEPARPLWPKDFKSFVSTIPPFDRPYIRRDLESRTNGLTMPRLAPTSADATKLAIIYESHNARLFFQRAISR